MLPSRRNIQVGFQRRILRSGKLSYQSHNNFSYLLNCRNDGSLYRHQAKRSLGQLTTISARRTFSFTTIPKLAFKVVRLPAAIGGGLAAGGSYVYMKVEEATSYTNEQFQKMKEMSEAAGSSVSGFFNGAYDSLSSVFKGSDPNNENKNNNDDDEDEKPLKAGSGRAITAGAAAVAMGSDDDSKYEEDDDDDDELEDETKGSADDQILNLTKRMIEIRNLLSKMNQNDALKLPSIVVVGSQSSGKSSVLEAIVGRQFLPKGNNMVTRRPIELTLINDPETQIETAEFTDLKGDPLSDFSRVANILQELNLAVPATEAISPEPIRLTIRSPRAPDLTLIDLPGYIQVQADDQPTELKQKIRDVCKKYLEPPNIILAISPADVDLANSSALRAAKLVDPLGERTLGVVTKMDLIEPARGREILKNNRYPLKMGYVGVISKVPERSVGSSLFSKKSAMNLGKELQVQEQNYFFKENEQYFYNATVGTKLLKKKLMKILEKSMSASLLPTHQAIQRELEDASYKFKVEFNDRTLTPETYLASTLDSVKVAIKEFSAKFGRNEIRSLLKYELDQKVLDLLALRYWNKPIDDGESMSSYSEPILEELPKATENDLYWHRKLDLTTSSLTKLGIGRFSTTLVTNSLLDQINEIINNTNLQKHPLAKEIVMNSANAVLGAKFYSAADQVENCIKPYKYEIDLEDREWSLAKDHTIRLLQEELKQCSRSYSRLKDNVGSRKLGHVVQYLEKQQKHKLSANEESLQFSKKLIHLGKEAIFLQDRMSLLKMRLTAVKSKGCAVKENKYKCPEIFLNSVVDKLTQTAVLFLNVELLSDFYYNFPRDLDVKLSVNGLSKETIENIAKEDEKVKRHIELQQKKELLEEAMAKIEQVIALRDSGVQRFK